MEYPVSPATLVCPVCLKKLPTEKESAEYHVNGCVDMCAKLSSRPTLKQKQSTLRAFLGITEAKVSIKVREEGKLSQLPFDKQLPAHKRILGTPFVVDAFNYGSIDDCQFYFLRYCQ